MSIRPFFDMWPQYNRRLTDVNMKLVMLRSTFAAYNAAHPDKPLINPRGAARSAVADIGCGVTGWRMIAPAS